MMNYCIDCGDVMTTPECHGCKYIREWAERDSGRNMDKLSKCCYTFMFEHFAALHTEMGIDSRREGFDVAQAAAKDHGAVWAMSEHLKHFGTQYVS